MVLRAHDKIVKSAELNENKLEHFAIFSWQY